jgi:hypothetical protein
LTKILEEVRGIGLEGMEAKTEVETKRAKMKNID